MATTETRSDFVRELTRRLSSGKTLFWAATEDDATCLVNVRAAAKRQRPSLPLVTWNAIEGWAIEGMPDERVAGAVRDAAKKLGLEQFDPALRRPENVLRAVPVLEGFQHALFVLWNFEEFFQNPIVREALHCLARDDKLADAARLRPIVFLCSSGHCEPDPKVASRIKTIDFGLPTREEIRRGPVEYIVRTAAASPSLDGAEPPSEELLGAIAKTCAGLTESDIVDSLAYSAILRGGIVPDVVVDIRHQKAKLLSRSRVLAPLSDAELADVDDIGGMEQLIDDIRLAAVAYSDEAEAHKLDLPSGVIVMGMPGTGKSLCAKAAGRIFRAVCGTEFPVVRIDIGAIFQKMVGESERAWRNAKHVLRVAGPCVGFIDEVQRALGGMASGGGLDSGVGERIYGDFLSWASDRFAQGDRTYMVYTMNSPKQLAERSPEFFRRVDEKYFADLPDAAARKTILKIHLRRQLAKNDLPLEALEWEEADFDTLAEATDGFVGDEIAKAVVKARAMAFAAGARPPLPRFDDLIGPEVIGGMKHHIISVVQKRELEELREFCRDAKPVGRQAVAATTPKASARKPVRRLAAEE